MVLFTALPDALVALWLKFLANGVQQHRRSLIMTAGIGLGVSAVATWYLRVVFDRLQRRFRDRVAIALESHVARLQATIATIDHQERPALLDRLSILRDQVFALDHQFMSIFSTLGWFVRLVVTVILLGSIDPVLIVLPLFALPTFAMASWRPGRERAVEEANAPHNRLARHLFTLGTTAPPGKEVRVLGIGDALIERRRSTWQQWYDPVSGVRWTSAMWYSAAWSLFGVAYVGAIVYVATRANTTAGSVLLVLAAGGRLSQYVGAAVGELGFLRGIWLESSKRLTWLEDYAAATIGTGSASAPDRLVDGIRLDHLSFRYPGTDRLVLDDVSLTLPAGAVVAVVGENGAGKSTLVKLLCRLYTPTTGTITVDGTPLDDIATDAWRDRLAGAFQDFFRFEFAAQRTVGLGELDHLDDRSSAETAVGRAGAGDVIDRLAHGLDTQLGPSWDEGVEVSFGQWQKLALARGFMRGDPLLLVLDEPTAALDAETEHALFEQYAAASREGANDGRITLLVSHRFSTVRMADLIVVLDGAHLVEFGSHDDLMARGAQYAELFAIQAAAFR